MGNPLSTLLLIVPGFSGCSEPSPAPLEHAYYVYDGDGNLVKSIVNETVTYFVGKYYQKQVIGTEITFKKIYIAGSKQIAMRTIEGSTTIP